ncbi:unnamed protein product [Cuscuta europaea]|uniref:DUF4283 domain-containing protein n=1 Tax=Cuscuta europaea TaxID=41803 RepID=A0A9P0ZIQ2_CUSEU|nr:unnamed protein product [Cuscuta europaea]
MGRTKQGFGDSSTARITRSRYAALEDMDDDFPALKTILMKLGDNSETANKSSGHASPGATATGIAKLGPAAVNANVSVQTSTSSKLGPAAAKIPGHLGTVNATSGHSARAAATGISPGSVTESVVFTEANTTSSALAVAAKIPGQLPTKAVGEKTAAGKSEIGTSIGQTTKTAVTPNSEKSATELSIGISTAVKHVKLAETSGTKPWNSLFKDNRDPNNGIKLKFVPPKGETLDFGDRVLPSMVEMWGHCLVGHFTGRFPGLKAVHDLRAKWGVRCLVRSHNKDWIIFKFQNEEDRSKVLLEGPYTVFGKLIMLKELAEDFTFEDEEFLKIPIWVKFPKLPVSLWNEKAMSEVAL